MLAEEPRETQFVYSEVTFEYRRRLPHLVKAGKPYYVTFCTIDRNVLPPGARSHTLRFCTRDHQTRCWIDCIVVMPDHVHLIFTPYDASSPSVLLGRMKGRSSYEANKLLGRRGVLWQQESFDRIVRCDENLNKKREYILNNPVRAGLVERWQDYPWLWTPWSGGL